ncbi:MAG: orotidine-5'-phosphate decarboxylase [Candidatus Babeliales bacterium]
MKKIIHILIVAYLVVTHSLFAHQVIDMLDQRIKTHDTIACCGLDPDPAKLPQEILALDGSIEEKILIFLKTVVDLTADHVCAYKIQKAFFDPFNNGPQLLCSIINYIRNFHSDIPIFLDCKIGDTGNTMQAYLHTIFEKYSVDGVVVNPYMGDDIFDALAAYPEKLGIVLVQTSNPGARIVQNAVLSDGRTVWRMVLDLVLSRWNKHNNLIPVLSSTVDTENIDGLRQSIPDSMPILFAGVGAQGGNPQGLKKLLNKNHRGVFVNSSRDLLYPYTSGEKYWQAGITQATIHLKNQLNKYRTEASEQKFLLFLGVSGAGKSTIIEELKKLDSRIIYITPYTTRVLRPGESNKISVSLEKMEQLEKEGQLLAVNKLYGTTYGTPLNPMEYALRNGQIPVIDWPISNLALMRQVFGKKLFCVYITPPNLEVLQTRLANDGRDKDGNRFLQAQRELDLLTQGAFASDIDILITNQEGNASVYAREILKRLSID